ncbi:MAG: class I SAM-dependent methyltransferase [Trueperaceae bacterium]
MTHEEALELLRPADFVKGKTWADLGAGTGTFTKALAELLGKDGLVHAVDKDKRALNELRDSGLEVAPITMHHQDFTKPLSLENLDGILMTNALHFVRGQAALLNRLKLHLKSTGKFVVIEYNIARANPWVPFPISFERLKTLAAEVGFQKPVKLMTKPSRYHREMYVASVKM